MDRLEEFLEAPGRQGSSLEACEHRPWELPERPWAMGQSWEDLLFVHWPCAAETLAPLVPAGLSLDLHDGSAWIGVTPFRIAGLRLRGMPPVPVVSRFLETNVRTYVTRAGKPGILFFSLDAASAWAVLAARRLYRLPYFVARMRRRWSAGRVRYSTRRLGGRDARLSIVYGPAGPPFAAASGTLEHFLVERYCLYAVDRSGIHRADIHHAPWPLQPATAEIEANTLLPPELRRIGGEPLLHFSRRQDVVIWSLERAGG